MVELKSLRSGPCLALAIAVLLLLVGTRSSACERVMIPPTGLHPTEAVFIGTVADIADPEQGSGQEAPARVKVKVRKAVQASPGKNVKEYTILLYGLGADCSKVPLSRSRALEAFPPGTEVWVIGEVDPRNPGVVEVWDGSGYIIANKADERVNLRSRYDYCRERTFGPNPQKLAFELRKDLARLRQTASEKGRASILKRLAFYPSFRGPDFLGLFEKLVDRNLDDEALIQDVRRFHDERIKGRIAPVCGSVV